MGSGFFKGSARDSDSVETQTQQRLNTVTRKHCTWCTRHHSQPPPSCPPPRQPLQTGPGHISIMDGPNIRFLNNRSNIKFHFRLDVRHNIQDGPDF